MQYNLNKLVVLLLMLIVLGIFSACSKSDFESTSETENIKQYIVEAIDIPTQITAGIPLSLTTSAALSDATNKTITWSVKDPGLTGASIADNVLYTTNSGEVLITATVELSPIDSGIASLTVGSYYSMALKKDGTLWAWGSNECGQLGDGTNTNHSTPVCVSAENDWRSVFIGDSHTIAVKKDGTLWAWGGGEIGDGTRISRNIPVWIGNTNDWKTVSACTFQTLAIKIDGSLWAWGDDNGSGRLLRYWFRHCFQLL